MTLSVAGLVREWNREERGSGVDPTRLSFHLPGDAVRADPGSREMPVLLLHGLGGDPDDLRELGRVLHGKGHPVLCPLLPAHGRSPDALSAVRFPELLSRALESADALALDGARPAIVGQSLGAVLGICVAARRAVARFVALAPALRPFVGRRVLGLVVLGALRPGAARGTLRWQLEARRGIREARRWIGKVTCPLVVMQSRDDDSVSLRGAVELHDRVASADKFLAVLDHQGHVLTRAPDRETVVFPPIVDFLAGATAREAGSRTTGPPPASA